MNKKELQEALIARGELAEKVEELNVAELRELWAELEDSPVLEVEVPEPTKSNYEPPESQEFVRPQRTDPEWQTFILKQFSPEELYKDKNNKDIQRPTVQGLRRLVEKYIGPILLSEARVIQTPTHENQYFATCTWTIEVYDREETRTRRWTDVADHHHLISEGIFRLFASSNAATRAEGRALRKLLNINVACIEEMANISNEAVEEVFTKNDGKISLAQSAAIKQLCKRLGMTVSDFLNGDDISSLSYEEASDALDYLNKEISEQGKKNK